MLPSICKKPLILVPVIMVLAIGLVTLLAWTAMKPINKKNGFARRFDISTAVTLINVTNIDDTVTNICGHTSNNIFFKTTDPSKLLVISSDLKTKKYLTLNLIPDRSISSLFNTIVDSEQVVIWAGNAKKMMISDFYSSSMVTTTLSNSVFSRVVRISPGSFIIRGFDSTVKTMDQIFMKAVPGTGVIQRENNISPRNNDAGLSTDGSLQFDKKNNLLIYTYRYQNQIVCFDTNLNLIKTWHTIDTIASLQLGVENVKSKNMVTSTTPTRSVNLGSYVFDGRLYVNSGVKADNETSEEFENNSMIDIYDIRGRLYQGSLRIPHNKGEKMRKFAIWDNTLIALYKSHISSFQLSNK